MNAEQARTILSSFRPGHGDEADPLMARALELAGRDPELKRWFEEHQAVDVALLRKVSEVEVPGDLAERILRNRPDPADAQRRFPIRRLALAALIVLFLGLTTLLVKDYWNASPTSLTAFQSDMTEFLAVFPRLDLETERWDVARQWLADQAGVTRVELPAGLRPFPTIGCRKVTWRDQETALLCLMVDGEVVHLFVLPRSEWPEMESGSGTRYARTGDMTTATWSDEETIYLALSRGSRSFLAKYL